MDVFEHIGIGRVLRTCVVCLFASVLVIPATRA